ncbi:hypothetical protein [Bacillus sp. B-jedd]|uniref:hypothetical protein n=1 Tax=Bacillus sp. B-jedd TaxID=1476857 RepID=UPI0005155AD5|nr:hypothetical protein [Bacillus sp. B-jedd]CEG28373.1 hypothetical protein BN1002_03289 [Bacillus sp. B-jedd]
MQKILILICILLLLIGCSDHSKGNEQVEKGVAGNQNEKIAEGELEKKPEELRDLSYQEISNLAFEMMDLATKIQDQEIDVDSVEAKKAMSELYPKVKVNFEMARDKVIPKLDKSTPKNSYYIQLVNEFLGLANNMKRAIEHGDFTWGQVRGQMGELQTIMDGYNKAP